jgi:hypothetical protein
LAEQWRTIVEVLMAVETRGNLATTALLVAMDVRGLMV